MGKGNRANLERLLRFAWEQQTMLLVRANSSTPAIPSIPKKDFKLLWIGFALGAGVACMIALIAGNGALLESSIIALVICGSLFFSIGFWVLEWPNRYILRIPAMLAISLTMVCLGYKVLPPRQTTPENVEARIVSWCNRWGFSVEKRFFPGFYFQYRVGLPISQFHVTVARPMTRSDYLQLENDLLVSKEDYATLSMLSEDKRKLVREEISLELAAKTNVGYDFSPDGPAPLQQIVLQKVVQITAKVDENSFLEDVKEMDLASTVASRSMALAIQHNRN